MARVASGHAGRERFVGESRAGSRHARGDAELFGQKPAYGGADTSWRLCSPSDAPCGERSCNRLCSLSDASRPAQPQPPTLAPHVVARVRLTVALRMSDMQARRGALDASPRCVHALGQAATALPSHGFGFRLSVCVNRRLPDHVQCIDWRSALCKNGNDLYILTCLLRVLVHYNMHSLCFAAFLDWFLALRSPFGQK